MPDNVTKVVVTFKRQLADDSDPDLSYLTQQYNEVQDPAERLKYRDQDAKRLAAYNNDEWSCVGVRAMATIEVRRPGYITQYELESPGLWGVENDSGEEYLNTIFKEECDTLKADIEAIVAGPIEWGQPCS